MADSLYAVTSFDLFERAPSKQEEKKIQIMMAAIELFALQGFEEISFDHIAKKCKISRPLVNHYFKNKEELFELSITYVRKNYQKFVLSKMEGQTSAEELLKAYIKGALDWVDAYPLHTKIWFLYFYKCSYDIKFRKLSTDFVNLGFQRIQELVKKYSLEKNVSSENIPERARNIQIFITGTVVSLVTEERTPEERLALVSYCVARGLKIANGD